MNDAITHKYKPGQIVFFLNKANVPNMVKCYICLGEGYLLNARGEKLTCTRCHGEKEIASGIRKTLFKILCGEVKMIDIAIQENSTTILYYINTIKTPCPSSDEFSYESNSERLIHRTFKFFEYELYETLEEAQKACENENSNLDLEDNNPQ